MRGRATNFPLAIYSPSAWGEALPRTLKGNFQAHRHSDSAAFEPGGIASGMAVSLSSFLQIITVGDLWAFSNLRGVIAMQLDDLKKEAVKLTTKELLELVRTCNERIATAKADAQKKIDDLLKEQGLTLSDIVPAGSSLKGTKFPAKYRNPANQSETWTGRWTGSPPSWLKREAKAKGEDYKNKDDWIAFADLYFKIAEKKAAEANANEPEADGEIEGD